MNNILTINNVRGYIDEKGTAQLSLEDCARGLGFIEKSASGNETIRWRSVVPHLIYFKTIATSCDALPTYIPENIFYRLAMKANNKVAEKFQAIVCDEILPAIRKTGSYLPKMTQQEILIETLRLQSKITERVDTHDTEIKVISEKLDNQLTIDHAAQRKLQKEIAVRVYTRLDELGYIVCATEKRKLFSALHREIKDRFAVSSYTDVRQKDFDSCLNYIRNWIEKK